MHFKANQYILAIYNKKAREAGFFIRNSN